MEILRLSAATRTHGVSETRSRWRSRSCCCYSRACCSAPASTTNPSSSGRTRARSSRGAGTWATAKGSTGESSMSSRRSTRSWAVRAAAPRARRRRFLPNDRRRGDLVPAAPLGPGLARRRRIPRADRTADHGSRRRAHRGRALPRVAVRGLAQPEIHARRADGVVPPWRSPPDPPLLGAAVAWKAGRRGRSSRGRHGDQARRRVLFVVAVFAGLALSHGRLREETRSGRLPLFVGLAASLAAPSTSRSADMRPTSSTRTRPPVA